MQCRDKSNLVILTDVTAAVKGQRARGHLDAGRPHCRSEPTPRGDWHPASGNQLPAGPDLFRPPLFSVFFSPSFTMDVCIKLGNMCVSVRRCEKHSELERMSESHPFAHALASLYNFLHVSISFFLSLVPHNTRCKKQKHMLGI